MGKQINVKHLRRAKVGLTAPQVGDKSFIGAYIMPAQKRKLAGVALMNARTITAQLQTMIDELEIDTLQAAKPRGG